MTGILDKYEESIRLTYNHTYRMLLHLKNIIDNFENIKNPDDITIEVYRDSIIKKYETLSNISKRIL